MTDYELQLEVKLAELKNKLENLHREIREKSVMAANNYFEDSIYMDVTIRQSFIAGALWASSFVKDDRPIALKATIGGEK